MFKKNIYSNQMTINRYFAKIFALMFVGVALSATLGYFLVSVSTLRMAVFSFLRMPFSILIVFALQIGLTIWIRKNVETQNVLLSTVLFLVYSATIAITFSIVFLAYDVTVILQAFIGAIALFGSLAVIGYTTKKDISRFSSLLQAALIAMLVISLINIFIFRSSFMELLICYAGLFIFMGLTVYDVQKLKNAYYSFASDEKSLNSIAVWGAMELYLDFINIFLYILRILGKSKK